MTRPGQDQNTWYAVSRRCLVAFVAALLTAFMSLTVPAAAHAADRGKVSVGAAPKVPSKSVRTGALAPSTQLDVDVVLTPRDAAGLQAFATAVSTPGSPEYRHYLPAGQAAAEFGPTTATIAAVRAALSATGLSVGPADASRVLIPVRGTAAQLQAAFGVSIATYRLPSGRIAYANTTAPQLPAAIAADVSGVVGLDDLAVAHPQLARATRRPSLTRAHTRTSRVVPASAGPAPCTAVKTAQTDWGAGWLTNQLASAYRMTPLYNQGDLGAGQTVALLELEPFTASDISAYQSCYGTHASVATVNVDGGATGSQSGESALDIENIAGFAPRSAIRVYSAPNSFADMLSAYSKMVSDDVAQTISTSWLICEQDAKAYDSTFLSAENTTFQQAAAQGQSVFAAAGDYGSTGCYQDSTSETELAVDDPASQPFVTGVGGTSLNTLGPPPGETAWNESGTTNVCGFVGGKCGSGGGGISTAWAMPSYQSASGVPGVINSYSSHTPCGRTSGYCREVPDISADGDVMTGYFIYHSQSGGWELYGGTSAAAPLWAAMTALINALPQCTTRMGFANPTLYKLAARSGYGGFNDVTSGNNAYLPQAGAHYPATHGYDLATGIGTPGATSLVAGTCQPATQFHPLSPIRLLDTRNGTGGTTGPVRAGQTIKLKVAGTNGIPSVATAVVLNLTVTGPTGSGFITAYPYGAKRPTASDLNFTPGTTRPNLAVVPIGASGYIDLYNGSNGTVQLIADASGYDAQAAGSRFTPTTPTRILDTRSGIGHAGAIPANGSLTILVAGAGHIPTGASAAALNVTVASATAPGFLTVYPAGTTRPTASNLNFTTGQVIPNLVVTPIGSSGSVTIYNHSTQPTQVVADEFGYYATTTGSDFTAVTPTRLLDTRNATGGTTGPVAAHGTVKVKVSGVLGIPSGAKAVVLNVTVTDPKASGFVTAYPAGTTRPTASNLNFTPGLTAPNLVIVPVSSDGYVDLYNGSTGTVQLIADCSGFYR